jgi:demethylmenaquinone methyltransferase/2-methoxy-6-polyprenyl-1,4-benzoquinol methylase
VYDQLAAYVKRGERVLDIGCGTGALTFRAAQKGAFVKGIDVNAGMLEFAQKRAIDTSLLPSVELCEMGVAELDQERSAQYDIVMSGLCFSELSEDELQYTLKQARRILKPGGLLLVADEVRPENRHKRLLYWLIRCPLLVITYLVTQTTTHAVQQLPEKVKQAGFLIKLIRLNRMESFIAIVAQKMMK